jgi:integrase
VMAWVERSGDAGWRVRFRDGEVVRSVPGFRTREEALKCAVKVERGWRPEPRDAVKPLEPVVTLGSRAVGWFDVLDVDERTEDNYRSLYRCHIEPRWGGEGISDISSSGVEAWLKGLRVGGYAEATVRGIRQLLSQMLADAADDGLIGLNPVRHRARGRRVVGTPVERVWESPEEALEVAANAAELSTVGDGLLILTAAWTGARWGELTGLQRPNLSLDEGRFWVDPTVGALHEGARRLWLGPPKTTASVRWVQLPPFLVDLLRSYLTGYAGQVVFPTVDGQWQRRANFSRRVMRPAADGTLNSLQHRAQVPAGKPGLTFHGMRHGHKTWLIEERVPEVAQVARLGHVLDDRIRQVYSHVAPSMERRLLKRLQARYLAAVETASPRARKFLDMLGKPSPGLRDVA